MGKIIKEENISAKPINTRPFVVNLSLVVAALFATISITWGFFELVRNNKAETIANTKDITELKQEVNTLKERQNAKDVQDAEIRSDLKYIKAWVEKQDKK